MLSIRRLALVFGFLVLGSIAIAASPLDDTDWQVEITPEGATIPHHVDRVHFKDGSFISDIFKRKGFAPSPFTHRVSGETGLWESQQTSGTDGSLTWKGELKGQVMAGTLTWKKPDGTVIKHSLAGGPVPVEEVALPPEAAGTGSLASKLKGRLGGCSLTSL